MHARVCTVLVGSEPECFCSPPSQITRFPMRNLFDTEPSFLYLICVPLAALLVASLTYGNCIQIMQNVLAQTQEETQTTQLQVANTTGDLTQASGGNVYGGERIGEIAIRSDGHQTDITGLKNASPAEGSIYEAWLGDAGGSEYKLSLGQVLENGTLDFSQHMVNPFTYTIFFITEEPQDDVDPNAADAIAGIELEAPFGQ
jgi:hypothetical protein